MTKFIPLEFWFNANPTLAFACGLLSYGDHVDELGNTYTLAAYVQGETFRIYGTSEERNQKYHEIGLGLCGIQTSKNESLLKE